MDKIVMNSFKAIGLIVVLVAIMTFNQKPEISRSFDSNHFLKQNVNTMDMPKNKSRILVVAPHNDDEAIGACGLVSHSIKNGSRVKVVMVTNGDGFKENYLNNHSNDNPKPLDYKNFGYERQKETIDAMMSIGVRKNDIYFLGYPDRGISSLWWKNFYTPYTSELTKSRKNPYNNSYTPNALYTGKNITKDMENIITNFKPDYIVYPHPDDRHPDHKASNFFVKYSLAEIGYKPKKELLYLVHGSGWPVPTEYDSKLSMLPPHNLLDTGTNWYSINLSSEEAYQKYEVFKKYKSQFRFLEYFFACFVRKNELFGSYPDLKLKKSKFSDDDMVPSNFNKIIKSPFQTSLNNIISNNSNIKSVHGEVSSGNNLNIFIEAYGNIEKTTTYHLYMVIFNGSSANRLKFDIKNGNIKTKGLEGYLAKGVECNTKGRFIHLVIPNEIYKKYTSILIGSEVSISGKVINTTAQRVIKP